jgi:hypothetical protein
MKPRQVTFQRSGPVLFFVPILAFVSVLLSGNLILLDYIHVMTGGMWTGIDLFMGIFGWGVMRAISPSARVEVAKRLTPILMFLMPSIASVATTAGYYLAAETGRWDIHSPFIIATGIVVLILLVQGFGFLLPNEIRVFQELRKERPNVEKIVKLSLRTLNISGSQAVFQIAIIFIMANLRFY